MNKAILILLCVVASQAEAQQVTYRDIDPDKIVSSMWPQPTMTDTVEVAYDASTSTPIILRIITDSTGARISCVGGDCQLLDSSSTGMVAVLDSATVISNNSAMWATPDAIKGELLFNPGMSTGHWQQLFNKYLGVRFKLNNKWHYSWVIMDVRYGFGSGMLTTSVKAYAYQNNADASITTGQTVSVSDVESKLNGTLRVTRNNILLKGITTPVSYIISSVNGSIVLKAVNSKETSIDITSLPTGVFIIHLENNEGHLVEKIFKQ